jgi:hypothetical protein
MRIGNFSLLIPQGREYGEGYVELAHGTVYTIRMHNMDHSRRCDALVKVDGKDVGGFRLNPNESLNLEHPSHDKGCFTFFKADSREAAQAGGDKVAVVERGVVSVTFKPERKPITGGVLRSAGFSGDEGTTPTSYEPEVKTCGGIKQPSTATRFAAPMSFAPGVTGLTGQSDQNFYHVPNLDYDPALQVTCNLRLVASGELVREMTAAPRSNRVPDPV